MTRFASPLLLIALVATTATANELERVWLDLTHPRVDTMEIGPLGLIDVRGRAGAGRARERDVVLVVDISSSTLLPSGADVDQDGQLGRTLRSADDPLRTPNPRRWCSDPGDTIRAAELASARRFAAALEDGETRLGLVTFADRAELRAPLGPPSAIDPALDQLEKHAGFGGTATNLADALDVGLAALLAADPDIAARERSLVVLSDGAPEGAGAIERAAAKTRRAARELARYEVRVYALALGTQVGENVALYEEIADTTGGRFQQLHEAADVLDHLAALDLSRVKEVRVENRTLGASGRAVRVSPDGRFDGVVAVAPGTNRIRVTARGPDGDESVAERVVRYDPRDARTLAEAQVIAARLEWLRARTTLLELGAELEQLRQRARQRVVDLEPASIVDIAAPPPSPTAP